VAPGGYAWWYVDALSDDRRHGLTMIAFIGSVFSPYYALSRRRGDGDPYQHCAINLALYGAAAKRWCMTERGRDALDHSDVHLRVGPSGLTWHGDRLEIDIAEWGVPVPRRIVGRVTLHPLAMVSETFSLDNAGRHRWRPIAPLARAEVRFDTPRLAWSGSAYLDHNRGSEPLEAGFARWDWSRSAGAGATRILYDATLRNGAERALALEIDRSGALTHVAATPRAALPATLWRIGRATRCEPVALPRVMDTLEDTPFYARSLVETTLAGERAVLFHESLDLDRFAMPIVQAMLPFRMPRRPSWRAPARRPL
jgi:carotenoid 1,2-hydratase